MIQDPLFFKYDKIKKGYSLVSKDQLRAFFVDQGAPAFRGNQVYEWLWKKSAHDFEDMTNLSKKDRAFLADNFSINHIQVDDMQRSSDGTIKNAVRLHDGLLVESVLIPTETRTILFLLKWVQLKLQVLCYCSTKANEKLESR